MIIRPILGIPVLIVGLGMGILFALPVLMASIKVDQPTKTCRPVLATNVKKADAILIGQVEVVLQDGDKADVWITPTTWYKGKVSTQYLRLIAAIATNTGKKVGLNFASGPTQYLLFLHHVPDGRYQTSVCAGSRLLGAGLTEAEQAAFKALAPAS